MLDFTKHKKAKYEATTVAMQRGFRFKLAHKHCDGSRHRCGRKATDLGFYQEYPKEDMLPWDKRCKSGGSLANRCVPVSLVFQHGHAVNVTP